MFCSYRSDYISECNQRKFLNSDYCKNHQIAKNTCFCCTDIIEKSYLKDKYYCSANCDHTICFDCMKKFVENNIYKISRDRKIVCQYSSCNGVYNFDDILNKIINKNNYLRDCFYGNNDDEHRNIVSSSQSDIDRDIQETLSRNRIRTCPTCGIKIIRSDACNDIRCVCGAHMCYHCGRQNKYHSCPQWTSELRIIKNAMIKSIMELTNKYGSKRRPEILSKIIKLYPEYSPSIFVQIWIYSNYYFNTISEHPVYLNMAKMYEVYFSILQTLVVSKASDMMMNNIITIIIIIFMLTGIILNNFPSVSGRMRSNILHNRNVLSIFDIILGVAMLFVVSFCEMLPGLISGLCMWSVRWAMVITTILEIINMNIFLSVPIMSIVVISLFVMIRWYGSEEILSCISVASDCFMHFAFNEYALATCVTFIFNAYQNKY